MTKRYRNEEKHGGKKWENKGKPKTGQAQRTADKKTNVICFENGSPGSNFTAYQGN